MSSLIMSKIKGQDDILESFKRDRLPFEALGEFWSERAVSQYITKKYHLHPELSVSTTY